LGERDGYDMNIPGLGPIKKLNSNSIPELELELKDLELTDFELNWKRINRN